MLQQILLSRNKCGKWSGVTIETVRECELANESGTGTAAAKLPHRETSIARCWTREPYHRRQPPKSAGREQYGVEFIARLRQSGAPLRDLIATATGLNAATIAVAVQESLRRDVVGEQYLIF